MCLWNKDLFRSIEGVSTTQLKVSGHIKLIALFNALLETGLFIFIYLNAVTREYVTSMRKSREFILLFSVSLHLHD